MTKITPLLRFLRALTSEQRKQFAAECRHPPDKKHPEGKPTTRIYLYQLAAQPQPNPTLWLAREIVRRSRVWGDRVLATPLTYDDLLVGVGDDDAPEDATAGSDA